MIAGARKIGPAATFAGHPLGLAVLFSTELWERFSFYGMRALLIFYLTQHFLFGDAEAYRIYGAYMALVFGSPLIGGLLGDRLLGQRRAVLLGGSLLALGHFGMAIEGDAARIFLDADGTSHIYRDGFGLTAFHASLALLIAGVGLLKPNIATLVSQLYDPNDPRRDAGFVTFYMSINLGGALAAIVCGYLGQVYGWRYGFSAAGVGMLFGLFIFIKGQRYLGPRMGPAGPASKRPYHGARSLGIQASVLALFVVAGNWLVQRPALVGFILTAAAVAVLAWLGRVAFFYCSSVERKRLLICVVLILFAVCFWVVFEQGGSSLNLFTDRFVDRNMFGIQLQASQLQAVNPILVLVFGPFLGWLWTSLANRGRNPDAPSKFVLALLLIGVGFLVLSAVVARLVPPATLPIGWLLLTYLFVTMAELCLAPIGLATVTKLAPASITGTMVGAWYLGYGGGNFLAALAATLAGGSAMSQLAGASSFGGLYLALGVMALAAGGVLLVLVPVLRRAVGEPA